MVCCPVTEQLFDRTANEVMEKPTNFPENCGAVSSGNRITGGVTAVAGEYPWMALLGYLRKYMHQSFLFCVLQHVTLSFNYMLFEKK